MLNYWVVVCSLGHRNNWRALILINECLARVHHERLPVVFVGVIACRACEVSNTLHMHVVCGHAVFTFNMNTEMAVRG